MPYGYSAGLMIVALILLPNIISMLIASGTETTIHKL